MVGPSGRVIAPDVQPKMTAGLKRRLSKAGFNERLDARTVPPDSLGISELCGKVDFTSVFAMVHEISSSSDFFAQASAATKTGGELLLVEPSGHVKTEEFNRELADAAETRFEVVERPVIRRSHAGSAAQALASSKPRAQSPEPIPR